jgi:hypothetical protein
MPDLENQKGAHVYKLADVMIQLLGCYFTCILSIAEKTSASKDPV